MQPILDRPIRLGVLISGGGTTLVNLLQEIGSRRLTAEIPIVIADRPCAGIDRARDAGLECDLLPRRSYSGVDTFSAAVFDRLRTATVDLVVLAGFLARLEIPADFVHRVMNIHPALIPAFCGHGMHGRHVHAAVLERGCTVSGCTVHFCDNEYDHGPIVLQQCVPVEADDTPETLATRVFTAECSAYPEAIRRYAAGRLSIDGNRVRTMVDG
ncbi:MAG: phosphoribosylglycinamide formyltransferase [Planctomycetaceae bacterium]|nr:phosphoribosylglycinamide formyltransferase [Planctomycetaceae bacterium]